ncbi:MAG: hypothetical protein GY711_29305 [bacterium]|nr:hypothetical protein [bacterium]
MKFRIPLCVLAGLALPAMLALRGDTPAPRPVEPAAQPAREHHESDAITRDARIAPQRELDLLCTAPDLEPRRIAALLEASDQMVEAAREAGEEDVGEHLRRRLAETRIDEVQARAFHAEHRDTLFGGRGFEASRFTAERLLEIRQIRAEAGL